MYCCPSEPFGPPPTYTGAPMNEDGAEHLYVTEIDSPVVNFGVSILASTSGSVIDPFVLGSKDENDVQGYAGIPTDVNPLTFDGGLDVGAAGAQFPRLQRFYVAVDSRADPYTNHPQKGKYLLNAWTNDLTPPAVHLLTTRVTAGRPLIVAEVFDLQSGVDPLSLVFAYGKVLIGASLYDPASGLVVFGLPPPGAAAADRAARRRSSPRPTTRRPRTSTRSATRCCRTRRSARDPLRVVAGPTVSWIEPPARACALRRDELFVVADSTSDVQRVVFRDGARLIGTAHGATGGVYSKLWRTGSLKAGLHHLSATVFDAKGRAATAVRAVRVCT